jgi:hypothetical protein
VKWKDATFKDADGVVRRLYAVRLKENGFQIYNLQDGVAVGPFLVSLKEAQLEFEKGDVRKHNEHWNAQNSSPGRTHSRPLKDKR